MRDRQYLLSLAVTAAVATAALVGTVSLVLWLGWGGAVGLGAMIALIVGWFYLGPRPDLKTRTRGNGGIGPNRE